MNGLFAGIVRGAIALALACLVQGGHAADTKRASESVVQLQVPEAMGALRSAVCVGPDGWFLTHRFVEMTSVSG